MARSRYLVAYDISDDRRLRAVHSCVKGFGYALQYSVFICDLDKSELVRLKWAFGDLIAHAEDRVAIVDLGDAAVELVVEVGRLVGDGGDQQQGQRDDDCRANREDGPGGEQVGPASAAERVDGRVQDGGDEQRDERRDGDEAQLQEHPHDGDRTGRDDSGAPCQIGGGDEHRWELQSPGVAVRCRRR